MPLQPDTAPWSFIEAAWAMMIDHHYSNYGKGTGWAEYAGEEWVGAIKGPINRALVVVESALQEVGWHGHDNPRPYLKYVATAAAQVNKLTQHVVADAAAYWQWSDQVVEQLKVFYPLIDGDELGDVVPAEAIDPSNPFEPPSRRIGECISGEPRLDNQPIPQPPRCDDGDNGGRRAIRRNSVHV